VDFAVTGWDVKFGRRRQDGESAVQCHESRPDRLERSPAIDQTFDLVFYKYTNFHT